MEWVNPKYTDLMKALKQIREERRQRGDHRPVRLFITVPPGNH